MVAGSANNQLKDEIKHSQLLKEKNISLFVHRLMLKTIAHRLIILLIMVIHLMN